MTFSNCEGCLCLAKMMILNFNANICTVIHDHSKITISLHGIRFQEKKSSLLNQKVKAH